MVMVKPHTDADTARDYLINEYGLAPGGLVHVIQRHVSRSGMTRYLSLFVNTSDGMYNITANVAAVLGERVNSEHLALKVTGCGMDMHFHTVYRLAQTLFDDGYALTHRTL